MKRNRRSVIQPRGDPLWFHMLASWTIGCRPRKFQGESMSVSASLWQHDCMGEECMKRMNASVSDVVSQSPCGGCLNYGPGDGWARAGWVDGRECFHNSLTTLGNDRIHAWGNDCLPERHACMNGWVNVCITENKHRTNDYQWLRGYVHESQMNGHFPPYSKEAEHWQSPSRNGQVNDPWRHAKVGSGLKHALKSRRGACISRKVPSLKFCGRCQAQDLSF